MPEESVEEKRPSIFDNAQKRIREWVSDRRVDRLPILEEKDVRLAMRGQVEEATKSTGSLPLLIQENDKPALIFRGENPRGKVPRDQAEKVLWEELATFGVDPKVSFPEHTTGPFDSTGTAHYSDGSTVQLLVFPGHISVPHNYIDPVSQKEIMGTDDIKLLFTSRELKDGNSNTKSYSLKVQAVV